MDQFTLSKIGNVTIQRVPAKTEDDSIKNCPNSGAEITQNLSPSLSQLPKLPPGINIILKSATNPSVENCSSRSYVDDYDNVPEDKDLIDPIEDAVPEETEEPESEGCSESCIPPSETSEICDRSKENYEDEGADSVSDDECPSKSADESIDKSLLENEEETEIGAEKMDMDDSCENESPEPQSAEKELESESELPVVKEEFINAEPQEYREDGTKIEGGTEMSTDELPEVPVDELIVGEIPEEIICKGEQFSEKEDDNSSDDADDELEDGQKGSNDSNVIKKKKKKRKTKSEGEDESSNEMKKQKTASSDEKSSDSDDKDKSTSELKVGNLRRNIRDVMDETKLDEATLAAQMQEKERLRRVQEQLRANRDRQMMRAQVLSLIEKGSTSIVKKETDELPAVDEQKPNTVVVLSSGSGPPQIMNKQVLDLLKQQNSSSASDDEEVSIGKFANLSKNLNKPQMMTSSVSIAPVKQDLQKVEELAEKDDEESPTNKDVVMISSSSGEDDDCIVISEDEEESEPEEDTGNSGMHTNDLYNVPDDQGRVLINVGHPENEKDVFLAPQIARIIKPHQIGGVRFLFDNIVESLDRYRTSEGFGCILAHSMGLGKTLQVISFCDVFLRYTEGRSVLCIMPINTLQNWVAEFNMWLPVDPENASLKEPGEVLARQFPLFVLNDNQKTLSARANVIQNWHKEGGVLLIGYELYRQLSLKKPPKSRTRSKKRIELEEDYEDEKSKTLLEIMYSALVKPGPDLVICDEGHRIKNSHASISQALKQIRSKRRVVLTGYPLQNNLLEYWCMVDFVRPNYLGTRTEFSNMFERPIQNGQCIDSTPNDVKLMRYRAHVLHSLLEGFVQRRSHRVLQQTLPSKYEFVLLLRLTPFQRKLYNTFMNEVVRTKAVPNPLKAFAVCCKIWNHPDILYNFLKKRAGEEDIDLDLDETVASIGTPASGPSTPMTPSTPPHQSTNKRNRNRGSKGSQGKDAKLPRKNTRTNTPQPINKPPSIAAVPPNTANNPKPLPPEHAITNANNQPIPPFNSYNNNSTQFQNFSSSNENVSFSQSNNLTQNFNNNQYSQQEFTSRPVTNSQDFDNVNYPQNVNDNNYYQAEYDQSNYWPRDNDNANFYNTNNTGTSTSTDDYYQSTSQSTSSSFSGEYSGQNESSQPSFANQNYNFDVNQQMTYSGEFTKQGGNGMSNFNVTNAAMLDANLLSGLSNPSLGGDVFADMNSDEYGMRQAQINNRGLETNASHFANQNTLNQKRGDMPSAEPPDMQSYNAANRDVFQKPANSNNASFGAFPPPPPKKRLGRPPLPQGRAAANRQKSNVNFRAPKQRAVNIRDAAPFPNFKPGLPGGSPILKSDSQNFQNVQGSRSLANDDLNTNLIPSGAYQQGQMNVPLLESIQNEELWNPNAANDPNAMFHDQSYGMYNDMPQGHPQFISTEATSLLGGVRAPPNLLNEMPTEIFNPTPNNYTQGNNDPNLFNLGNFGYINDVPMPAHTSFMDLLQGVEDTMEISQNDINSTTTSSAEGQYNVPCGMESQNNNFIEQRMQYRTAEVIGSANVEGKHKVPSVPLRETNNSIVELSHNGQNSLKVVEKKAESSAQLAPTSEKSSAPSASNDFSDKNRLPSIDVFNTSQNFVTGSQSNSFQPAYSYEKSRNVASTSLSTQTTWESFGGNQGNEFSTSANVADTSQNFQNFPTNAHATSAGKVEMPMPYQNESRIATGSRDSFDTAESSNEPLTNRFTSNQSANLMNVSEQQKVDERGYYVAPNKMEGDQGKAQMSGGLSPKMDQKSLPRRNQPVIGSTPSEGYKTEATGKEKNEPIDIDGKMMAPEVPATKSGKEEPGIPYDWTNEFFKDYEPGKIEASAKTFVFFCMLDEIIKLGDRLLLFSQSLFTLDLIEDFLHLYNIPNTEEKWARNKNYFRLDGSTSALEREKLINEFNNNPNVHMFLVSTRAGSLGINLVGANRVIVFDASWNPCHDTQAVCRVYRYGQQKSCYVYRFVMDNCLEKKIYDRQINKQGMSDRIVDECNPDAHLTIKDVSNLCWDNEDVSENKKDMSELTDKYNDVVMQKVIKECSGFLSKEPFQHESLLVDRTDKKLSQAEKRMAKRGYELEKQASLKPSYGLYNPPFGIHNRMGKPMASVRPMPIDNTHSREPVRRWIPAEVWEKQGMTAHEMTLPLDIVIPTNTADPPSKIELKAKQKVMVLKSQKGIYMQLENGRIIAIQTAPKTGLSQPGKVLTPSRPPNLQQSNKMYPKPHVDKTALAALSTRRDVTVSPVRNRFPVRPNPVTPMQSMSRPNQLRSPVRPPAQPIIRTFPLPRTQGRPSPRMPTPAPAPSGKQIFGPNSAVTISLANRRKMESQMRAANVAESQVVQTGSQRPGRDDYVRNFEKEDASHYTEINYEDRARTGGARQFSASRMIDDSRKMSTPYSEYSHIEKGMSPKMGYNHQKDSRSVLHVPAARKPAAIANTIPETLKHKKDINLTPIQRPSPSSRGENDKYSILETSKPKIPAGVNYQQQQHYPIQSQAKPSSANIPKRPPAPNQTPKTASKVPPIPATQSKPETPSSAKNVELPKSGSHSISIFPVGKKSEEDGVQQTSVFQPEQQSYPQQKSSYYSNYQGKQQFSNLYPEKSTTESQYNNPYDVYKQNYQNFPPSSQPQPAEYSPPQQGYSGGQYPPVSYSSDYASGSYGPDNPQYSNAVFSNSGSQSGGTPYDQYGSFYNYPPKNVSSQPSQGRISNSEPPPTQ